MAIELGERVGAEERFEPGEQGFREKKAGSGLSGFARKKPLGAVCGLIIVFFIVIGDLVPETANKLISTAGGGRPVPYVADQLERHSGFIYHYAQQDLRNRKQGPSSDHLLGTDQLGRDILSRLLYGARTAVVVSFGVEVIAGMIGAIVGIATGYYGGWFDKLGTRLVDVLQALPGLVVLITIMGLFARNTQEVWPMVFAIGFISWPYATRIIRAQTLYVMTQPYMESAKVIGASDRRLMLKDVLPNVFPLIILTSTLRLGGTVLLAASLAFLGYGLPSPFPDWGTMLSIDGRESMRSQPALAIYPGVAIGILVFSYNLFGDALRDVLDPRFRGSR